MPSSVTDEVPEQRILECSMLLPAAPVVGAVTGWASLRVLQGGFFDGLAPDGTSRLPVPLAVGPNQRRRPRPGVVWLQERLDPAEIRVRHGIPHTVPERAIFNEMRRQTDVREAVVAIDMAVAGEITSIDRMRRYVALRAGSRGVAMVRAALDLADEASRSPQETRVRLIWVLDAGLPRLLVNVEIFGRGGRLLGIADLLEEESGTVSEFDGADHAGAARRSSDASRDGAFRDHQLEVFRVTGFDLHQRPVVVRRMQDARRRARWLPPGQRPWALTPPPGWASLPELEERLERRAGYRAWLVELERCQQPDTEKARWHD